jgi:hypothetical protein
MHHPFRDFVDGSVTAGSQDQVGATIDVGLGNVAGCPGARGGGYRNTMPSFRQNIHDALDARSAAPSEFPCTRIVDQDGVPVACNGKFSGFLVKL